MRDHPLVYVIILNWNNYEDTKRCLESLNAATYPNLRTLVVDNGSADGSGKRLQADFPDLHFIFNDKNLGFSRGCNVGIRAALADEQCAYVLLLNNDAVVAPSFLEGAIEVAEADAHAGLLGGKILFSPESKKIWYAGGDVLRWRGQVTVRGFREMDAGQYDEVAEVGFITGALMLIKRSVLESVGLLPEEYYFGVEEADYSLAVKQAGYRLLYVPDLLAYHRSHGSHSNHDMKFFYNNYRGKLILQEKYLPKPVFMLWLVVFRLYSTMLAARTWQRLRNEDAEQLDKRLPVADMKFALRKAIEDHGKDVLSEESLSRFEAELKRQRQVARSQAT